MKKNLKISIIGSFLVALFFYSLLSYSAEIQSEMTTCSKVFSESCRQSFKPMGTVKKMHYYSSLTMDSKEKPTVALIVIHGFKHSVRKAFNTGVEAARQANKLPNTFVIAPVFYVDGRALNYKHCINDNSSIGDSQKDLVWSCQGWMEGAMARNDQNIGSFDVLDALVTELHKKWPSIKDITIAGFSAGGQTVQRYVGYAQVRKDIRIRYVIADPSSWFYFDPQRPMLQKDGKPAEWQACLEKNMQGCDFKMEIPDEQACANYNTWKYGIKNIPTYLNLKRTTTEAKSIYAQADVYYVEGALDVNSDKGTVYKLLDKSCAAKLQGPYRLQRGLSFAAYDRALIAPDKKRRVTIVPNCKHNIDCVFSSEAARAILFPQIID